MAQTKEQWQNGVKELRDIIPAERGKARRIGYEVNQIQARVELITEETREVLGISQTTINVAIQQIEGVTGGVFGLEEHWRNRWPTDAGNVTPEQLLEISKENQWSSGHEAKIQ